MNELSSTEFRKTFARLEVPTIVTVNGHRIGRWEPWPSSWEEPLGIVNRTTKSTTQAQRDDLLRKINRSK